MPNVFYKAPNASLTYTVDWAGVLGSDTITGAPVWTLPTGITLAAQSNTTTTATIEVSGGTVDTDYILNCAIATAGGLADVKQVLIKIRTPELLTSIRDVRRYAAELTATTYEDEHIEEIIKRYSLPDRRGSNADYLSTFPLSAAPVYTQNPNWVATYDLHAAAAAIWEEKAAEAAACAMDFRTEGVTVNKSQKFAAYMRMASYHKARRMARAVRMTPENRIENREGYIVNDE